MGRFPNSLLKGPFEMAHAYPGEPSKLMKGNNVAQMLMDKFEDNFETAPRQSAGTSKWRSRNRGICMDDMMGKELAGAFCVEISKWGRRVRRRREPVGKGINHRVPDEKLRQNLDAIWFDFPMLGDHAGQERAGHEKRDGAGMTTGLPCSIEASRCEIDRSGVGPALDRSVARLSLDTVPTTDVHAQGEICKGDRGVKRCFDYKQRKGFQRQ